MPAKLVPAIAEADLGTTHYTPVYLDTKTGVFDVEGYVPKEAILDTGATKVMLSKKLLQPRLFTPPPWPRGQSL